MLYMYVHVLFLCRSCLTFVMAGLPQQDLDNFSKEWNEHPIQKSAVDSPGGISNDLYDMPEMLGMYNVC